MKNSTLLLALLFVCSMASSQLILTDFDGTTLEGIELSAWSYNSVPDTVANPVTDGINTSATSLYWDAHWFYSYWGWVAADLVIKNTPADAINDHTHYAFEYMLVQDTATVSDTVEMTLVLKGGADPDIQAETVPVYVDAGAANVWETMIIEIPPDNLPTDNTQLELFCGTKGTWPVGIYYDNFRLTTTVGIKDRSVSNDFKSYIDRGQVHVMMKENLYINHIDLYNITGALVQREKVDAFRTDFNFETQLESGIYIIRINTKENIYSKKIVSY